MPDLVSVADLPRWHPPLPVLEFAELVLSGILPALPDGLPQPPEAGPVVLEDAEGTPVALWTPAGRQPGLSPLRPFSHGPLRSARRTASQVKAQLKDQLRAQNGAQAQTRTEAQTQAQVRGELGAVPGVVAVPVTGSLTTEAVKAAVASAAESGETILWVALIGAGRTGDLPPLARWRAVKALAQETGGVAVALALPVAPPGTDDDELVARAARAFGATTVREEPGPDAGRAGSLDPLRHLASMHPAFERERLRARPGRYPGATIFFTGLSGSGKSTVAKALAERITEGDDETPARVVSLLDGDEVRRMLSAGLGFSRADRDLNILRIGWVAAEITRHGGLAVCAPIAPFDVTRQQVREMVGAVGEFVLVHVSTPLAECERRDRKGLYAKARAGEIPEFTGISSPYEEPADADLRLDTSQLSVDDAVEQVLALIQERGLLTAA